MARFFFHVRLRGTRVEDSEGMDLPDVESARREAVESAKEMVANAITAHEDLEGVAYEIADASGKIVLILPLAEAAGISVHRSV
jgi:hypothetical protein